MNFILSVMRAGRGLDSCVFHWIDLYLNGNDFSDNRLKQSVQQKYNASRISNTECISGHILKGEKKWEINFNKTYN